MLWKRHFRIEAHRTGMSKAEQRRPGGGFEIGSEQDQATARARPLRLRRYAANPATKRKPRSGRTGFSNRQRLGFRA